MFTAGLFSSCPREIFPLISTYLPIKWDTTEFRWYVDGIFYQNQSQWHTKNVAYPAPFDQYFHLLLNVAVGGNWPGDPDNSTVFPQQMVVDYVRVFKKKS
jgi:beta-glucanase (GH16 family)